ncbi:Cullin [Artemisia annua]|uniref:Cullin n=1 Tax=Artemisia annua TaxID=35608 RepID=A0A2U1N5B2_ARTAN|nr:Cullin [Artemisia annua]
MTSHIKRMAASIEASQGSLFLEELNKKWMEHDKAFGILRFIFTSMDSTCIPSTHKAHVQELGVTLWVDNIINYGKTEMKLKAALLETVQRDREGVVVNRDMMRSIFYRGKCKQLIKCCDCGEYLKEAENCLEGEIKRVSDYSPVGHYIDLKSVEMITSVVEKEMIESHMLELIRMEKSGLVNMIVDDKYDDLARMYSLFGRVPNGITAIKDVMTCHIRETGKQLVTDPERFKGPVDFSPEFISLFVDDKLRKAEMVIEEDDRVIVLDKVVILVCYLQDKERSFLLKLKVKCGSLDFSDLENMLKDIKTSLDTVKGFYEDMKPADGPRLGVHVPSTGSWPSQLTRTTTCNLPPEIIRMSEKFRTYYLGIHKRRKLIWQTNMGSAAIKATFGTKQYKLSVSTYQMCVLMLFNNAEQLIYKEIEQAVEIPTMELKRCLQSLACAVEEKKNVLRKEPISTDINEDDVFTANMESEPEKQETVQAVQSSTQGIGS